MKKTLPYLPLPKELEDLPPLPPEEEKAMRLIARKAVELVQERYRNGSLQKPKEAAKLVTK